MHLYEHTHTIINRYEEIITNIFPIKNVYEYAAYFSQSSLCY
jgi:hypothetical protein